MDRTGGVEPFMGGEAARADTVTVEDIMSNDHLVSGNSETEKRTFLYPSSVVRRMIFDV